MTSRGPSVHPYIPNSVPEVREKMLKEIGVQGADELFAGIPDSLRLSGKLRLPEPLSSEYDLRKHVEALLSRNRTCKENLNFLGAGCWQHYVPAVCNEIASRGEFVSAYDADTYTDSGKFQALFEFQSMLGELVGMDVVSTPVYDWPSALSSSLLMASRITGRNEVLIPKVLSVEKRMHLANFCKPTLQVRGVDYHPETGGFDLEDYQNKVSSKTAAVYFENPSYLGFIESHGQEISRIAHSSGALCVVGVDPSSLGILKPPGDYGADIVCGDAQPLGIPMNYGGGALGFIATRDEEEYVAEYPAILISIAPTKREGEWGFGRCTFDRTSYVKRETSTDFTGTTQTLWGITAAVYLALMGPQGMRDLGETVAQKSRYAMRLLSQVEGVKTPIFRSFNFKEFTVNFDETRKTVAEINRSLLNHGIFGGKDISREFPELGNSALYSVTEIHSKSDIDLLVNTLEEVLVK